MRVVSIFLLGLFLAGCGSSNDPVIPQTPTEAPASAPTKEGLPESTPMKVN